MWSFSAEWEDALWRAARAILPPGALEPAALAAGVSERSRRYTSERERLGQPLPARERDRDLAARALFFTVADAGKIAVPLAELADRGLLPAADPLRVLDLGAGAGAMCLGVASALPGRRLSVVAVDRDATALALLEHAVRLGPGTLALTPVVADLAAGLPPAASGRFDLVVAGTLVNELPEGAELPLTLRLLGGTLRPDGALILVEPALRETSRRLHRLRDAVVEAAAALVFAPCTRQGSCPALDDERDWCHEDRPFQPPPHLASLLRAGGRVGATGLRQEGLKFSYVTLLGPAPPPVQATPSGRVFLRVVSDALDSKGVVERMVCGTAGRSKLRALKREGERARQLRASRRGDVLEVEADGSLRVRSPA